MSSFDELVGTRFADGVNALCWVRDLPGDFDEVVAKLASREDITSVDPNQLQTLSLSEAGRVAASVLLRDHTLLRRHGLDPVLDCIRSYPRDEEQGLVPTDVYSFHADSATVETDTYLCSYTVAASEGLRQEDARRCVDLPEVRSRLLQEFGGRDDESFAEYLNAHCYDLHYVAVPGAEPFSFGLGNLWRIAVDYPGSPVPPCVHRAPSTTFGQSPRLLLIS